jgi:hypothetical protein
MIARRFEEFCAIEDELGWQGQPGFHAGERIFSFLPS